MVEGGFGPPLLPESSVDEELRAGALQATIPVVLIHCRRAYRSTPDGRSRRLAPRPVSFLIHWYQTASTW
jgi:hypothetical protein